MTFDAHETWENAFDAFRALIPPDKPPTIAQEGAAWRAAAAVIAQAFAEVVAERDSLRKCTVTALAFLRSAPLESGVCCCGDAVDTHTMGSGHSPVDDLAYYAGQLADELSQALGTPTHDE